MEQTRSFFIIQDCVLFLVLSAFLFTEFTVSVGIECLLLYGLRVLILLG